MELVTLEVVLTHLPIKVAEAEAPMVVAAAAVAAGVAAAQVELVVLSSSPGLK